MPPSPRRPGSSGSTAVGRPRLTDRFRRKRSGSVAVGGGRRGAAPPKAKGPGRAKQLRAAYALMHKSDKRATPLILAAGLGVLLVFVLLGIVLHHPVYFLVLGIPMALMAAMVIFGRRASTVAFSQVDGQPGAAAAVLSNMRGNWRVSPAVAVNRNSDLVHRVIGKPGIVLVAEGEPARLPALIAQERRRITRIAADTPVYDLQAGDGEGQVPLRKLQTHLAKLPGNIKPAQVNALEARMKALGGMTVPIPKGPMPKGGRMPRGKMR